MFKLPSAWMAVRLSLALSAERMARTWWHCQSRALLVPERLPRRPLVNGRYTTSYTLSRHQLVVGSGFGTWSKLATVEGEVKQVRLACELLPGLSLWQNPRLLSRAL